MRAHPPRLVVGSKSIEKKTGRLRRCPMIANTNSLLLPFIVTSRCADIINSRTAFSRSSQTMFLFATGQKSRLLSCPRQRVAAMIYQSQAGAKTQNSPGQFILRQRMSIQLLCGTSSAMTRANLVGTTSTDTKTFVLTEHLNELLQSRVSRTSIGANQPELLPESGTEHIDLLYLCKVP